NATANADGQQIRKIQTVIQGRSVEFVARVPISKLRFAKTEVDPFLWSGKEPGHRLSELLVATGHVTLHHLRLVNARIHGDVIVVEGIRLLYALREAEVDSGVLGR
ncbi:MAG: hypothetical protein GY700_10625, partial [Propionibacteriaceae bacterium]|nr:hypothetical protein [Propionibacteriaceae bacterium]